MKKFFIGIVAAGVIFTLAACDGKGDSSSKTDCWTTCNTEAPQTTSRPRVHVTTTEATHDTTASKINPVVLWASSHADDLSEYLTALQNDFIAVSDAADASNESKLITTCDTMREDARAVKDDVELMEDAPVEFIDYIDYVTESASSCINGDFNTAATYMSLANIKMDTLNRAIDGVTS